MAEGDVLPLFEAERIRARVQELSVDIARTAPHSLVVVGLLKGCFIFIADLVRALREQGVSSRVDFLTLSSYGNQKESSGTLKISGTIPSSLSGKPVLLVDDVADTGRSLAFVKRLLEEQGALRIATCVLVDKPSRREVPFEPDFVGFTVRDEFVVGYGIDYAERFRNLPFLGHVR